MSWASSRRTLILIIVFSVIAAVAAVTLIATLYETPSCGDGKKNQDEEGIDCGGGCQKVCSFDAAAPLVSFVRDVQGLNGRTDVVAYVENPNGFAAAKDAAFTVELYDDRRLPLAKKSGMVDLPPGTGVPLFLADLYRGNAPVAEVFLTFDTGSIQWYRYDDARIVPRVSDIRSSGTREAPRVSATLTNPSAERLRDIVVVATVFDAEDTAIAATQTIVPGIPPQDGVSVLLTFGAPFVSEPARIDVRPVVPLP